MEGCLSPAGCFQELVILFEVGHYHGREDEYRQGQDHTCKGCLHQCLRGEKKNYFCDFLSTDLGEKTSWSKPPAQSSTDVFGSDPGRPHHVPVVVQHGDALGELAVPHQTHVTDVGAG